MSAPLHGPLLTVAGSKRTVKIGNCDSRLWAYAPPVNSGVVPETVPIQVQPEQAQDPLNEVVGHSCIQTSDVRSSHPQQLTVEGRPSRRYQAALLDPERSHAAVGMEHRASAP